MNLHSFKLFLESLEANRNAIGDELVNDSINDKGRLKALFVAGIPGSGKSYTVKGLSGSVKPAVINIDTAVEHRVKKLGIDSEGANWKEFFQDSTEKTTKEALFHALNGIRPLFIDGTSGNYDAIMHRKKMLEEYGYDVGMVFVHSSIKASLRRIAKRNAETGRVVDAEYVEKNFKDTMANLPKYRSAFDWFAEYDNDTKVDIDNTNRNGVKGKVHEPIMDNDAVMKIFRTGTKFFEAPLKNQNGIELIKTMQEKGASYATPDAVPKDVVSKIVSGWYAK